MELRKKKNIVIVLPSLAREGGIILGYNISSYLINKGFGIIIVSSSMSSFYAIERNTIKKED